MNLIHALLVGSAVAACSGCFTARPSGPDWFYNAAARNLTEKPIAHHDEKSFTRFVRKRAEAAWEETCRTTRKPHGDPYHDGFVEGFVDYVEAGGTGEPPYLPPFRYRLTKYRTADGIAVVEDWYAGFRHGAAVARVSGLRELNYVPLPGPPIPADTGRPTTPTPVLLAPAPLAGPPSSAPVLPLPRPVPHPRMLEPTPPPVGPAVGKAPVAVPARPPTVTVVRGVGPDARPYSPVPSDFSPWQAIPDPRTLTVTSDQ